jgi:ATP-binding cassette, subfamily B, bacterial PglK
MIGPSFNILAVDAKVLILIIIGVFFSIYVLKTIALVVILKKQMLFVYTLQANLSRRLFESYLMRDYSFHIQRNSSELIRNTITAVNLLVQNGVLQLITLIAEVTVLVGVICFLIYIDPLVTIAATLIVATVVGVFFYGVKSRILSWGEKRQFHEGLRIQHVQQGLGGIKDIKLLGKEGEFVARFALHTDEAAKVGRSAHVAQLYPRPLLELVGVFIMSLFMLTIVIKGIQTEEILPVLAVFGANGSTRSPLSVMKWRVLEIIGAFEMVSLGEWS